MTTIADVAAEVRTVAPDAPWRWLGAGWRDLLRAPQISLGYGFLVVGGGGAIIYGLWRSGLEALIPVAFGAFAILGPMLALGTYELSRRLAAGEAPAVYPPKLAGKRSITQIAYIGFTLMFAALVWLRVAIMLYALFTNGSYVPLPEFMSFALGTGAGLSMIAIGTAIGGVIAFSIYIVTVISIPMLMNEDTDSVTAIAAGIVALQKNPRAMLLWAWLIAVITIAGVATVFVGLAIAFPVLGHATWHAYRDLRGGAVSDLTPGL
ncbi:MAG: DUF2189 domain-containing protein [Pseudomonadota bacterium]